MSAAREVTNPQSDRVKSVRALAQAAIRQRRGQYLVEGPQGVREAVRHSAPAIRDLYITEAAAARYPEIEAEAHSQQLFVHPTAPQALAAMSPDAQGVLAVLEQQSTEPTTVLSNPPSLIAVLHQVRDPGNAGTVIRVADAAGAGACILTPGSVEIYNPKVVRSTTGSLFHLPVLTGVDLAETVAAAHAHGMQVLAADGSGELDLDELAQGDQQIAPESGAGAAPSLARPTVWVFGNEAHGLSAAERDLADATVRIPIYGKAESLNLAMAATICLYSSARAQRIAHSGAR